MMLEKIYNVLENKLTEECESVEIFLDIYANEDERFTDEFLMAVRDSRLQGFKLGMKAAMFIMCG